MFEIVSCTSFATVDGKVLAALMNIIFTHYVKNIVKLEIRSRKKLHALFVHSEGAYWKRGLLEMEAYWRGEFIGNVACWRGVIGERGYCIGERVI